MGRIKIRSVLMFKWNDYKYLLFICWYGRSSNLYIELSSRSEYEYFMSEINM